MKLSGKITINNEAYKGGQIPIVGSSSSMLMTWSWFVYD